MINTLRHSIRNLIILSVFAAAYIPLSCTCDMKSQRFGIESFRVHTIDLSRTNSLDSNQFAHYDSIAKVIMIDETYHVLNEVQNDRATGFVSGAYACSEPENFAFQTLTDLTIVARTDVEISNELTFNMGDTITGHFSLSDYARMNDLSIAGYISEYNAIQEHARFFLMFRQKPDTSIQLDFDLHLRLSDGSTFVFNNEVLKIK